MDELKTPFEWERETNEKLRARIAELGAALEQYRHECPTCHSTQLCQPTGYEWEWECADSDACEERRRNMPPPPPRAPDSSVGGLVKQTYEKMLLESARKQKVFLRGR